MSRVEGLALRVPRIGERFRALDPTLILWVVLAAVLVFLVVYPLSQLVLVSFQKADGGGFTLANYAAAYSRPRYVQALWNSLVMGAAVGHSAWCSRCRWPGRSRAPTCRPSSWCGSACSAPS